MSVLIVLEKPRRWALDIPGVEVVAARDYLIDSRYSEMRRAKVFNLCRTTGYQTTGYYVSLLAAARGHKPLPSVSTIQDLRQAPILRIVAGDMDALIQKSLSSIRSEKFELSIYFGHNLAQRHDRLANALFNQFPAPLLAAEFRKHEVWELSSLRLIAAGEVPESHRDFLAQQAHLYFSRQRHATAAAHRARYDLAILANPSERFSPSDPLALTRFARAAKKVGLNPTFIEKDEYGRIAEYDALFIRETTYVNHHTYRFARRAAAEGMVVIDDPESIVRCTNKVYLAELFQRHGIACPKTVIIHRDNQQEALSVGFPCVVKRPDSSFSLGVVKAHNPEELTLHLAAMLEKSELALVQEYLPSDFDWRIGVLDGRPLYACRYFMARGDWRIQTIDTAGKRTFGKTETLPIESVPTQAVNLAVKSAKKIGDGLYGVDIKQVGRKFYCIEVNDNPSIESGIEDSVLKDELYLAIMRTFYERLESRGRSKKAP